ncbi:MAG: SH3 domain-containing protein [Desulfurellales bacterium]|jgi:hypothetical protein|nr:MAG: SH3 domain-containing protein [Desulfurellales bacterium]
MPSLLTAWVEPAHINNKQWVLDWFTRLNPTTAKVCGSIDPVTGAFRLEFPDQLQARLPNADIIYRPYAENENSQWKLMPAKVWVTNARARLEGRPYRVTFCCEPAPSPAEFGDFMRYSVQVMEEADRQGLKVDMWGFPAQFLTMFTDDPRDIRKGGWADALKVAGALRGTVQIDIHDYTGLVAPAGTYDDAYMRSIMTDPDLLRYEQDWPTFEDIESRPYQTRHLFRDMWLNRYALELGIPEHDMFIGECIYDYFGDEWDLRDTWARANAIAGDDLNVCVGERKVGGIRTLPNVTRWKFPHLTFKDAIVAQLRWHGQIRARNPRIKGYALYMLSDKDGDQRPHNWLAHTDILDACIGLNPVVVTPAPAPKPTPVPVPTPAPTPAPLYLRADRDYVNLRPQPTLNNTPITTVTPAQRLKVVGPENAEAMVGHIDMWIQVQTPEGITGWIAAWLLRLETTPPTPPPAPTPLPPPPKPSWRGAFDASELAWIDREAARDTGGVIAKLVTLLQ